MKKVMKKTVIIMIMMCIIIFTNIQVINASGFNPDAFNGATTPDMDGPFAAFGGRIIYLIQYVGYTIAVLVLLGIGIKYMMSSPSEKADLKGRLVPYVIGAVLLFGGVSIISLIYTIIT